MCLPCILWIVLTYVFTKTYVKKLLAELIDSYCLMSKQIHTIEFVFIHITAKHSLCLR